jgi:uncharacterized membrane protein YphA (DoxX/SURF4 family)
MKTVVFLLGIAFGALFIWSGVGKLKDPISFVEAIRNFRLVGDPYAVVLALFIPWVELFAGIGVMWDKLRAGSAWVLALSLLGITLAIISAWARGLDISCGCFGGDETINYPIKIAQNLGLIGTAVFLWRAGLREVAKEAKTLDCLTHKDQ